MDYRTTQYSRKKLKENDGDDLYVILTGDYEGVVTVGNDDDREITSL